MTTRHTLAILASTVTIAFLAGCMSRPTGDDALLDVFPPSAVVLPAGQAGRTQLSTTYNPSGSLWGPHLDERNVFQFEMRHEQDAADSFALRIGKGGQLYSLRGPFGESVPPQGIGNPWNDEVWQFVSVCGTYNGMRGIEKGDPLPDDVKARFEQCPYADTFFIHNSGAYNRQLIDSGTITVACDVMLDRNMPGKLNILLRDTTGRGNWKTFGTLAIADGTITCNDRPVRAVNPGQWYHIVQRFVPGAASDRRLHVAVSIAGEPTVTTVVPFAGGPVRAFSWFGLTAAGEETGCIYVDNIAVDWMHDGQTETLFADDFEAREVGATYSLAANTNREKGADVTVTDRLAAGGRHCLEMRDAPGLQYDWQPFVQKFLMPTADRSFYCPLLGTDLPADGRTVRTVNWGIVPQLKTIHRSPILYYVQTRDVGDGIIEITWAVHNFSVRDDIVFDFLNVPWGGTRITSLPHRFYSTPDGVIQEFPKKGLTATFRDTGGWILASQDESPDSPSLAIVYGRDRHWEAQQKLTPDDPGFCQKRQGTIRGHRAWEPENWRNLPENEWRNYDVVEAIFWCDLKPGQTFFHRSCLVVNARDRAIELSKSLVDKVDYGMLTFDPNSTPMVPVRIGGTAFELFAKPVPGSMPLFLLEDTATGREVVTSDPYIFVPQEKLDLGLPPEHPAYDYFSQAVGYSLGERECKWKRLLGYGYRRRPATGNWVRLSERLPAESVPPPTAHHLDLYVKARAE